jgi:mRNA interferase RelE/StbE
VSYKIEFSRRAERDFKALPRNVQVRLAPRIDALARNPRPAGVEKLKSEDDLYRIRIGHYRVIYKIEDKALIVLMLRIGNRREVYRRVNS